MDLKEKKKAKENVELQQKKMAEYQLNIEIKHQQEESDRRSLVNAMAADARNNRSSFNTSATKVLRNYQGNVQSFGKRKNPLISFNPSFTSNIYM